MDRRIAAETKWSREGISARRKRNQGRLRELEAMRLERARAGGIAQRSMKMETGPATSGGQLVLEAIDLGITVPAPPTGAANSGRPDAENPASPSTPLAGSTNRAADEVARRQLLNHFNLLVRRSDRIGIVGPNGIGKSSLVKVLLGLAPPDSGRVRQGFGLEPAYFDQQRAALDRNASPWTVLTGGSSDMIEVAGATKHVTAYLRDFLFDDHKMTQKVATLSGGEQNRLLLAKLFAETHNFLVLDEPTNDLDMETLDLLQEVIADYDGTILIVSRTGSPARALQNLSASRPATAPQSSASRTSTRWTGCRTRLRRWKARSPRWKRALPTPTCSPKTRKHSPPPPTGWPPPAPKRTTRNCAGWTPQKKPKRWKPKRNRVRIAPLSCDQYDPCTCVRR